MSTYLEVIKMYQVGFITKEEANKQIEFFNMGSDYTFYELIK
jgi:hypothetical protein